MTSASVEHLTSATKSNIDAMTKPGNGANHLAAAGKANADALANSGNAAVSGFQELAKAYQTLATRNAEKMTASIQALAAVKTPAEFIELQRKLIAEGVDAAVGDWSHFAKLTVAVFTNAFDPIQKQAEILQNTARK